MKTRNQGFTLVELLVVIGIIAILTAVVVASVSGSKKNTNYLKRVSDLGQMNLQLQKYNSSVGKYPTTGSVWYVSAICPTLLPGSVASSTGFIPNLVPTYASSLPSDIKKAPRCGVGAIYAYKSNGQDYKLIVFNDSDDKDTVLQKNPMMVDPIRSSTSSTPSFGYWSSGGSSY
jgi:prepilin-type N-terminal cleavage/methylation domain-containing protein